MPFTQEELEAAYKQMEDDRKEDYRIAELASNKLTNVVGPTRFGGLFVPDLPGWHHYSMTPRVTPYTTNYELITRLCEYDDWDAFEKRLASAGIKITQSWTRKFSDPILGEYDLTDDPEVGRRYKVRVAFYATGDA